MRRPLGLGVDADVKSAHHLAKKYRKIHVNPSAAQLLRPKTPDFAIQVFFKVINYHFFILFYFLKKKVPSLRQFLKFVETSSIHKRYNLRTHTFVTCELLKPW
jgi:hypothetical protein